MIASRCDLSFYSRACRNIYNTVLKHAQLSIWQLKKDFKARKSGPTGLSYDWERHGGDKIFLNPMRLMHEIISCLVAAVEVFCGKERAVFLNHKYILRIF